MINPDDVEFMPLTGGYVAMVDTKMYPKLSRFDWKVFKSPTRAYAVQSKRTKAPYFMHHHVLKQKPGFTIDHRYSDTPFLVLDERRNNLRYATVSQQGGNRRKNSGVKLSKFKGVSWHKHKRKWVSQIRLNGEGIWLGYYIEEGAAACAYDIAALKFYGRFAKLNFPERQ